MLVNLRSLNPLQIWYSLGHATEPMKIDQSL